MDVEEKTFDLIAMAEETEKHLIAMCGSLPDSVCATVEKVLGQSPRVEAWRETMTRTTEAAATLELRVTRVYGIALVLALLVPVTSLAIIYWETRTLRAENAALTERVQSLKAMAAELTKGNPEGFELIAYREGALGVLIPKGRRFSHAAPTEDGREALVVK